jgi:hypothetical protein
MGVLLLALIAAATPARAESLTYEAYEFVSPSKRKLIDQGTLQYDPARDVITVRRGGPDTRVFWTRGIELPNGFLITAKVNLEPIEELRGFGLQLLHRRYPMGFSWEWYNREEGDEFDKLQGVGRVRIVSHKTAETEQLVRVEFLDDTELRFCTNLFQCQGGEKTHVLIVRGGSVLALGAPVGIESEPSSGEPTEPEIEPSEDATT